MSGPKRNGDYCRIKHGYAFKSEFFASEAGHALLKQGDFEARGRLKLRAEAAGVVAGLNRNALHLIQVMIPAPEALWSFGERARPSVEQVAGLRARCDALRRMRGLLLESLSSDDIELTSSMTQYEAPAMRSAADADSGNHAAR